MYTCTSLTELADARSDTPLRLYIHVFCKWTSLKTPQIWVHSLKSTPKLRDEDRAVRRCRSMQVPRAGQTATQPTRAPICVERTSLSSTYLPSRRTGSLFLWNFQSNEWVNPLSRCQTTTGPSPRFGSWMYICCSKSSTMTSS